MRSVALAGSVKFDDQGNFTGVEVGAGPAIGYSVTHTEGREISRTCVEEEKCGGG